jgi:SAM-dependent methyltransferase
MPMSFGRIYSEYYDILYMDKDYEKECDFLENVFSHYSRLRPAKILDIGCGTGGHLVTLAKRGYDVVGVDKSEWMVEFAKEKVRRYGFGARFFVADVLDLKLDEKFDACISMFAVVNYIVKTDDIIQAFKNVRRHLKHGGLFIFDYWYGPAVLTIRPSIRVKVVEKDGIKLIRIVVPELDTFNHIQRSNYYLLAIRDGIVVDEARETHVLRYLFPQELIHYLKEAKFKVLKFCEFPYLDKPPSENTWNVATIAMAQ